MFDPRHPVHDATRAMAEQGVVIVFAAGNSGDSDAEMSLNLFATAPWVIGVAAASVDRLRSGFDQEGEPIGGFSSNGLKFDNARPFSIGPNGHRGFAAYRMGMYHPDVTAPGVNISSSCASTGGAAVGPCGPAYGNETASGTSASSPHIAGAAAVLVQANPDLTPRQIQEAMQVTALPVYSADEAGKRTRLGFWQAGYGFVDLNAAVRLATSKNWARAIAALQRRADRRVLRSVGYAVPRSDLWSFDAPRVTLFGSDTRTFRIVVRKNITHLKVTLAHPSLYAVGQNGMVYSVTARDGAGHVLGTTEEAEAGHGTSSLFLDLRKIEDLKYGTFTFEVSGEMAVSDPDNLDSESLLGRVVVLQVAQLVPLR
jgi:serine protease AprX